MAFDCAVDQLEKDCANFLVFAARASVTLVLLLINWKF